MAERKLPKKMEQGIRPYGDGDGWRVEVCKGRNAITGKKNRKSAVVYGSYKKAVEKKHELLVELGDSDALKSGLTLDAYFERFYLPDAKHRLRPKTVYDYEGKYRTHIQKAFGAMNLSEINPVSIDAWKLTLSDKMRPKAFQLLHQILEKAVRSDLLTTNPCDRAERPKKSDDYEPDVLPPQFVPTYIELFSGSPIEAAFLLCIGCGLRRSELIALDWEDITDGEVEISAGVTTYGGHTHEDKPKSRFGMRTITIPPTIASRLEELRSAGAVVKNSKGERMHPDRLSKLYRKTLEDLPPDVPRVSLKNIRHTSLSLAADAGVDILAISRRAGHSGVGITNRYYLRPDKSVDRATASAMDVLIAGQPKSGDGEK